MEELEESKESRHQRLISAAVTVLLIFSVVLCGYAAIQVLSKGYVSFGDFMMFRVVTGSMEPTIPVGALMTARRVDINDIVLDDIVCFRTQEVAIWGKIMTHRVVDIMLQPDGSPLLVTKGDANLVADGYFVSQANLIAKVTWHTGDDSILASVFSFFTTKIGFLGCIVVPCLVLATLILRDCVANIRTEMQSFAQELEKREQAARERQEQSGELSRQEYEQMVEQIQTELMEEMKQYAEILKAELEKEE